jgi:hypothetical protein
MFQEKTMYRKLDCGCAYEILGNAFGKYYEDTLTKFIECKECYNRNKEENVEENERDTELKSKLFQEIQENSDYWFSGYGNSCFLFMKG